MQIDSRKLDWKAKSSGYGQGVIKRNDLDRGKDKEFEWSDAFKQRQQQSVFERLMGGAKKAKQQQQDEQPATGGAASAAAARRDVSPAKRAIRK